MHELWRRSRSGSLVVFVGCGCCAHVVRIAPPPLVVDFDWDFNGFHGVCLIFMLPSMNWLGLVVLPCRFSGITRGA